MLMRMFVTNGVAQLGGWLNWVAKTLSANPPNRGGLIYPAPQTQHTSNLKWFSLNRNPTIELFVDHDNIHR